MKYLILVGMNLILVGLLFGCGTQNAKGPQGNAGPAGPTGVVGASGPQGPTGIAATKVAVVQFCTACTPTYPSTFSEIGFCIDNVLYATYSANGGFSTELTPGTYSSDGENCSCTFTVGNNCQVTEN